MRREGSRRDAVNYLTSILKVLGLALLGIADRQNRAQTYTIVEMFVLTRNYVARTPTYIGR